MHQAEASLIEESKLKIQWRVDSYILLVKQVLIFLLLRKKKH